MLPFGLMNAVTFFMDLMNSIFKPYLDKFAVVSIDGTLIYSRSKEEHVEHLRTALKWIGPFFLGHAVTKDGISLIPLRGKQ